MGHGVEFRAGGEHGGAADILYPVGGSGGGDAHRGAADTPSLRLILLADIPLTLFAGRRSSRSEKQLSPEQRERLLDHCAAMWGFFDEQCGRENNFLPPDNIQFAPVSDGAPHLTTNIGLMLLSFLAARDLGFITSAELHMRLNLSSAQSRSSKNITAIF